MLAIQNATIVKSNYLIPGGLILTDGKTIIYAGTAQGKTIPALCETIDAHGMYVGPGLIDIHTHAGGNDWFYAAPEKAAQVHLAHGTTSVYPACYFNMSKEEFLQAICVIRSAAQTEAGRIIKGLYMEGPYLNSKFGCEKESNQWKGPIEQSNYIEIVKEANEFAAFWSVAPEREGILSYIEDVKKVCPNAIFTVAHSEASPDEIERLIPYGLKVGTHHTNATGDRPQYPECRGVCVDEAVNMNDEIFAELIVDSRGIHVDPYMLRLVLKIKGKDRIVLISYAGLCFKPPIPGLEDATDLNFDFNGDIAGSKLTLDVACRNMMVHTGAGICDVFRYASKNPATLLGRTDLGEVREGAVADLIIVDHWMNVLHVIQEGNRII